MVPTSDGPALGMQFLDFLDDGVEFFPPGFIDRIVAVLADIGTVGRNRHDAELVNIKKFRRLGFRGAGHARQFR